MLLRYCSNKANRLQKNKPLETEGFFVGGDELGTEINRTPKAFCGLLLDSARLAESKEVLEFLTAVMRGEVDEEITLTVGTGKGRSRIEKMRSQVGARERLKAVEMLGKVHGLFVTRQEVEVSGNVPVVIRDDV